MLLILDKPAWFTSFDCVRKLQKIYWKKTPIGHAWTLDPFATGVLVIWIGKSWTKRLHSIQGSSKVYRARIDLTRVTDTRDCDPRSFSASWSPSWWWSEDNTQLIKKRGRSRLWDDIAIPTESQVIKALQLMVWTTRHLLTPFNAKKIQGIKWYERARRWEPLFIPQDMDVYNAELIEYRFPYVTVRFEVWTGTYIRSLAHTLWYKLLTWWICDQLHRESVGLYWL